MKQCTVSIVGLDGATHTIEVEAASVFGAAAQAARCWSTLGWWRGDAVIEVRAGVDVWKVRAGQVREWTTARQRPKADS
jgi:hypothetical protein